MSCPLESGENAELFLDYCARRLNPDAAAVLERHIALCPRCRRFRDEQETVWRALDSWEALPASREFDGRLYEKIDGASGAGWWRRLGSPLRPFLVGPAIPVAAAAGLILVASFLFHRSGGFAPPGGPPARMEMVDAEQVDKTLEDIEMLDQFGSVLKGEGESSPAI